MKTQDLLAQLNRNVNNQLTTVTDRFSALNLQQLNYKPDAGSWSILECLEHLNRYSRYYLPLLGKAVGNAGQAANPAQEIRYTWLGRYSVKLVDPQNRKKLKTLKHLNPSGSLLTRQTLDEFAAHQHSLQQLLARAAGKDLSRKTIPIEFLRLLKMTAGEALEFVVKHQERHVQQAQRNLDRLAVPVQPVLAV